MIAELIPFKQVGPFIFNSNINSYSSFSFIYTKCDDKTGWDLYELDSVGIELYTENDLIVSIACKEYLFYKNTNIIGIKLDSFLNKTGLTVVGEGDKIYMPENDEYQHVIDFDIIGIQVWLKNYIIVSIFCSHE